MNSYSLSRHEDPFIPGSSEAALLPSWGVDYYVYSIQQRGEIPENNSYIDILM
jgi:hypothetical protein